MGYVNPAVAAAGSRAAPQAIMDAASEEMGGVSQTQEAKTEAAHAGDLLQAPRLARTPPGALPGESVIPSSVRMARTPPTAGHPGVPPCCAVCQQQASPSESWPQCSAVAEPAAVHKFSTSLSQQLRTVGWP